MAVEQGHVFPGNRLEHGGSQYRILGDVQSSVGTLTILTADDGSNRIVQRDILVSEAALVEEAQADQQAAAADTTVAPGPVPQGQPQTPTVESTQPPEAPPTSAANTPPGGNQ